VLFSPRVSRLRAVSFALLFALLGGVAAYLMPHPVRLHGAAMGDVAMPLAGMERFQQGGSPYEVRLRGSTPTLYPFPTMIVLWPLLLLPAVLVAPLFMALSSGALAYAILRCGRPWQLLAFASPPFWSAMESVQWSPLLMAALLLPPLLPLAVVKPQLAVVLAAGGKWTRKTIAVAAGIGILSLLIDPRWPREWLTHGNLQTFNGRVPLLVLPGFLLVAALAALRTREGRVMAAMSLTVQRLFYDQLLLFVLPRTAPQMLALLACSWVVAALAYLRGWIVFGSGAQDPHAWMATIVGIYLPALAITLLGARREGELWLVSSATSRRVGDRDGGRDQPSRSANPTPRVAVTNLEGWKSDPEGCHDQP
jgi:hypothetical protein